MGLHGNRDGFRRDDAQARARTRRDHRRGRPDRFADVLPRSRCGAAGSGRVTGDRLDSAFDERWDCELVRSGARCVRRGRGRSRTSKAVLERRIRSSCTPTVVFGAVRCRLGARRPDTVQGVARRTRRRAAVGPTGHDVTRRNLGPIVLPA